MPLQAPVSPYKRRSRNLLLPYMLLAIAALTQPAAAGQGVYEPDLASYPKSVIGVSECQLDVFDNVPAGRARSVISQNCLLLVERSFAKQRWEPRILNQNRFQSGRYWRGHPKRGHKYPYYDRYPN